MAEQSSFELSTLSIRNNIIPPMSNFYIYFEARVNELITQFANNEGDRISSAMATYLFFNQIVIERYFLDQNIYTIGEDDIDEYLSHFVANDTITSNILLAATGTHNDQGIMFTLPQISMPLCNKSTLLEFIDVVNRHLEEKSKLPDSQKAWKHNIIFTTNCIEVSAQLFALGLTE